MFRYLPALRRGAAWDFRHHTIGAPLPAPELTQGKTP
jgi:hypothetical protein